nr:hypothetical protein [Planctomycetota bacterium]
MASNVHEEYRARRDRFAADAARLRRADGWMALARGVAFVASLVVAIGWLATGELSPLWLLLPGVLF